MLVTRALPYAWGSWQITRHPAPVGFVVGAPRLATLPIGWETEGESVAAAPIAFVVVGERVHAHPVGFHVAGEPPHGLPVAWAVGGEWIAALPVAWRAKRGSELPLEALLLHPGVLDGLPLIAQVGRAHPLTLSGEGPIPIPPIPE